MNFIFRHWSDRQVIKTDGLSIAIFKVSHLHWLYFSPNWAEALILIIRNFTVISVIPMTYYLMKWKSLCLLWDHFDSLWKNNLPAKIIQIKHLRQKHWRQNNKLFSTTLPVLNITMLHMICHINLGRFLLKTFMMRSLWA